MIVIFSDTDIFAAWEEAMADISDGLRLKYGLENNPSNDKVKKWVENTEKRISLGYDREEAGADAAKEIFPDYKSRYIKSDADTISELLEAAKRKK